MSVQSVAVFVNGIAAQRPGSGFVVEASNGSDDGPPFVRFELPAELVSKVTIGTRFRLIIEEFPQP